MICEEAICIRNIYIYIYIYVKEKYFDRNVY